ncbi:radical SAM protein [Gordonibacter pamelaeae]|uniref:radical SAM protein n=1 Tax=Gordonibacter pamelaeae TaxID=471189 RepID=UPI002665EEDB|nr:radical SAM protein [Gordonibacter pamelaeae]
MQVFDQEIYDIVEKGLEGNGLSAENVLALYEVEETSKEAAYIRWAGQELSMIAADGVAEIHAQIGLNSTVCPKNCKFCSFAACNNVRKGKYELPKEDVLEYAKLYVEEGANLILMLTTASYSFDKLVDMVGSVREVIPADMPLLVNTDDMQLDQCRQLKAAGANGAYHAVRMCEGEDTEIPVEKRFETFANLREAGLTLSTCVEPVGPEHTPEELTEATMRCISTNPLSAGVGKRIGVPGTLVYDRGMLTDVANANMVAVYRLATGRDLRLNCSANTVMTAASGANLAWAEVGTNPRDTVERTEHGGRGSNIAQLRKMFAASGWQVLDGPSKGWMR